MNEIELNIKDAFLKYLEYVDKLVEENKELRKEIEELKDKECFDLQLKCSKLEQKLEKIKEYCIPDLMFTECMKSILRIIENEVNK